MATIQDMLMKATDGKSLDTSDLSTYGALNREQQEEFVNLVQDESVLLDEVRQEMVNNKKGSISKLSMDTPATAQAQVSGSSEGSDVSGLMAEASASFSDVTYDILKNGSYMDITREIGEESIEGSWNDFEEKLMSAWSTRIGNDLEIQAIQGNSSITADVDAIEQLLNYNDGWLKIANDSGNVIDWDGDAFTTDVFSEAMRALPSKYQSSMDNYNFYGSFNLEQEIRDYWEDRGTPLGDAIANGQENLTPRGVPFMRVPKWPDNNYFLQTDYDDSGSDSRTHVLLANPQNLVYVVYREMRNYLTFQERTDSFEGTFYSYTDYMIEEPNAVVLVKNIAV